MIVRSHHQIGLRSDTVFSDYEQYRYRLWREWDANNAAVRFIIVNLSTAEELANDSAIGRCLRRAMAWAYGGLEIANRFALRSTNP